MSKWISKNFCEYDDSDIVADQLSDFLNQNDITDFTVVQMRDNYLEIVFKEQS